MVLGEVQHPCHAVLMNEPFQRTRKETRDFQNELNFVDTGTINAYALSMMTGIIQRARRSLREKALEAIGHTRGHGGLVFIRGLDATKVYFQTVSE
jgi:hypothetical protein